MGTSLPIFNRPKYFCTSKCAKICLLKDPPQKKRVSCIQEIHEKQCTSDARRVCLPYLECLLSFQGYFWDVPRIDMSLCWTPGFEGLLSGDPLPHVKCEMGICT